MIRVSLIKGGIVFILLASISHYFQQICCNAERSGNVSIEDAFPDFVMVRMHRTDGQIAVVFEKVTDFNSDAQAYVKHGGSTQRLTHSNEEHIRGYHAVGTAGAITMSCESIDRPYKRTLYGFVHDNNDVYQITPIEKEIQFRRARSAAEEEHHYVRKRGDILTEDLKSVKAEVVRISVMEYKTFRRKRQASQPMSIDLFAVLDWPIFNRFFKQANYNLQRAYTDIRRYLFTIIIGMDMRYKTGFPSGTLRFSIRLTGYFIPRTSDDSPWTQKFVTGGGTVVDVRDVLRPLALDHRLRILREANIAPETIDHVMALSGYDLVFETSTTTLGYAYVRTICLRHEWSVSLVEDHGDVAKSSLGAAHELGHSMGALHDITNPDMPQCDADKQFIMTHRLRKLTASTKKNPWKFSWCSYRDINAHIETLNSQHMNCLRDESPAALKMMNSPNWRMLASADYGAHLDPDQQCRQILATSKASFYRLSISSANDICIAMYCFNPDTQELSYHIAAEGTSCGYQMVCRTGSCVPEPNRRGPAYFVSGYSESCLFGNQPGVVDTANGFTCEQLVRLYPRLCADNNVKRQCCASCQNADVHAPVGYGDVPLPKTRMIIISGPINNPASSPQDMPKIRVSNPIEVGAIARNTVGVQGIMEKPRAPTVPVLQRLAPPPVNKALAIMIHNPSPLPLPDLADPPDVNVPDYVLRPRLPTIPEFNFMRHPNPHPPPAIETPPPIRRLNPIPQPVPQTPPQTPHQPGMDLPDLVSQFGIEFELFPDPLSPTMRAPPPPTPRPVFGMHTPKPHFTIWGPTHISTIHSLPVTSRPMIPSPQQLLPSPPVTYLQPSSVVRPLPQPTRTCTDQYDPLNVMTAGRAIFGNLFLTQQLASYMSCPSLQMQGRCAEVLVKCCLSCTGYHNQHFAGFHTGMNNGMMTEFEMGARRRRAAKDALPKRRERQSDFGPEPFAQV